MSVCIKDNIQNMNLVIGCTVFCGELPREERHCRRS